MTEVEQVWISASHISSLVVAEKARLYRRDFIRETWGHFNLFDKLRVWPSTTPTTYNISIFQDKNNRHLFRLSYTTHQTNSLLRLPCQVDQLYWLYFSLRTWHLCWPLEPWISPMCLAILTTPREFFHALLLLGAACKRHCINIILFHFIESATCFTIAYTLIAPSIEVTSIGLLFCVFLVRYQTNLMLSWRIKVLLFQDGGINNLVLYRMVQSKVTGHWNSCISTRLVSGRAHTRRGCCAAPVGKD